MVKWDANLVVNDYKLRALHVYTPSGISTWNPVSNGGVDDLFFVSVSKG